MYFIKTPELLIKIFRSVTWRIPHSEAIYLTFDDGPDPDSTPALLNLLSENGIKATFFCLGEKAENYPEIVSSIRDHGHTIASHGYYHISGWQTSTSKYVENVSMASRLIQSNLFRPPYGKITPCQFSKLKKQNRIIMWDIMPGDFDPDISVEECVFNIVNNLHDGSIVVLHDRPDIHEKTKLLIEKLSSRVKREFKAIGPN